MFRGNQNVSATKKSRLNKKTDPGFFTKVCLFTYKNALKCVESREKVLYFLIGGATGASGFKYNFAFTDSFDGAN